MDDGPGFGNVGRAAAFQSFLEHVPLLPESLRQDLAAVPPSQDGPLTYRPCEVECHDGQVLDWVYVVEARSYFSMWGVAPWSDSGKRFVPLEQIRRVRDSPTRLPPPIANRLYEHGESGMGYVLFELILADGRRLACQTGNAVDFVALPDDVAPAQIVDVRPGRGNGKRRPVYKDRPYAWSIYQDESTAPERPLDVR